MIELEKKRDLSYYLCLIGLTAIGTICALYSLLWSDFAETHIKFPFLDFPIFVGEILLFGCVVIFILQRPKLKHDYKFYCALCYVAWVMFKAFYGYFHSGSALALRNAALFYYPFFAFLGYYFYQRKFFGQSVVYILFVVLLLLKIYKGSAFVYYFFPPYVLLSLYLITKMHNKALKLVSLAALVSFHHLLPPFCTQFSGIIRIFANL